MKKSCIIIMGPTAIGKTAIGIEVAQHFSTEIISADSRQCYKELGIGVAKPSVRQLQLIPHHFISSHSILDVVNAAVFEEYALKKIEVIFQKHDCAVMVGGTGLYIKTFCEGIDAVPVIGDGVREQIVADYAAFGLQWLQESVQLHDPLFFEKGEHKNPQRLMRALEVKISTGRSILDYHKKENVHRDFNIVKIGLEISRDQLINRIDHRVDEMVGQGLIEEVRRLEAYKELNALQTVGYKEIFGHLEGQKSLQTAIMEIKQHTRQYAKRQMTWFKKDPEIKWCSPNIEQVMAVIHQYS